MNARLLQYFSFVLAIALIGCGEDAGSNNGGEFGIDAGNGDVVEMDATADAGSDAADATEDPEDTGDGEPKTYEQCYPELVGALGLNYSDQGATIGSHCQGTDQQDISGVERVVFLGDSITAGSGASSTTNYRALLGGELEAQFGSDIQIDNCSTGGAVNADLLDRQIPECFPEPAQSNTLVIITSGGNDIVRTAVDTPDVETGKAAVDELVVDLKAALDYFANEENFPGGVSVVYANVYEYTDATGNLDSCRLAAVAGLSGQWDEGLEIYGYLESEYMRLAVERGFDMLFLEEMFCGHGWNRDDEAGPCYENRGELWMSSDCIHPNEAGHAAIADGFMSVITE
ncbi:MAG: SGNH/GDSL hydrolase family protein [Myxococcota bacterium]